MHCHDFGPGIGIGILQHRAITVEMIITANRTSEGICRRIMSGKLSNQRLDKA
jgi:hypothetical protein